MKYKITGIIVGLTLLCSLNLFGQINILINEICTENCQEIGDEDNDGLSECDDPDCQPQIGIKNMEMALCEADDGHYLLHKNY